MPLPNQFPAAQLGKIVELLPPAVGKRMTKRVKDVHTFPSTSEHD